MRKLLFAAALAGLAAPGRPHAQLAPQDQPIEIPGAHRPADRDGASGERGPRAPRLFVSPSGEPFRGPGGLEAWFAQADADHDGAITAAEFQADSQRAFRLYDSNADGVVDGFEIQAYEQDRAPEIGEILLGGDPREARGGRRRSRDRGEASGDEDGRGAGPRGAGREGAARFSLLNEPQPLLAADTDVDGKVTAEEWSRASRRRFDRLDRDHAGRLTVEKLSPAAAKR